MRKLIKSRAPNRLMDDCIELDSYIRSSILHGMHKINGEVSKQDTSGETFNISQFCEYYWFTWVNLDDYFNLGRYLEPSIDVGPAMIAMTSKVNDQVLYRSTYD